MQRGTVAHLPISVGGGGVSKRDDRAFRPDRILRAQPWCIDQLGLLSLIVALPGAAMACIEIESAKGIRSLVIQSLRRRR